MKYEIKKIIKDKIIWIVFAAVMAISIYMSLYHTKPSGFIKNLDEQIEDSNSSSYHYVEECYEKVIDYRKNTCVTAKRLSKSKDYYTAKLNQKILSDYEKKIEFKSVYFNHYINKSIGNMGNYASVLFLMFFCFIIVKIFYADINNDMLGYVKSTYKGYKKVYWNKMKSLLIIAFLISLLRCSISLLPQILYGSFRDMLNPIQSVEVLWMSPFNINLIELFLLFIILYMLGDLFQ